MTAGESDVTSGSGQSGEERRPTIRLGLVVAPLLEAEAVEQLATDVQRELAERYPDVGWEITAVRDALVTPPAALAEVVDAARSRLLDEHWDLVVHVTELPLRISRRPVVAHSSRTHSAALVSLPALGLKQSNRRLVESVVEAVGTFAGDSTDRQENDHHRHTQRVRRRLHQLATGVEGADALEGVALLHRVATGNLRLVVGMVRANRPWRLVTRLTRALVGALGVAALAVVSSDIWRIASGMAAPRLALLCVATIVVAVATLIAAHELWERAADRRLREQAILFNLVTIVTVAFGILALYIAVFALSLGAAALMLNPALLTVQLGRPSHVGDYVRLALLASALATIAGTLGGGARERLGGARGRICAPRQAPEAL
jgi:uncharacterized membrane protein